MEESVFFGNEGLTSTNANYYCNIAKESLQEFTERLNSVRFCEVSVSPIDGVGDPKLMTLGIKSVDFIKSDLERIANMNSFCAWVREAIKKKDKMLSNISNYERDKWAKEKGIEIPEAPNYPAKTEAITEEDVINSWDKNKRNKYLKYEAFASTYGKYIHPSGAFSKARKDAHSALNNPIYKEGSGKDLLLYYQKPSIPIEKIELMFMELQNIYRSYEKELNAMKAEIKESVNKLNSEKEDEYKRKLAEYKKEFDTYSLTLADIDSQFSSWKISEKERISKLNIVLPSNLLEIFNEIKKQCE